MQENNSLKNKTIKGGFWSFVDSFLGQGVGFVVGLVLARLLTPHEYGLIGIVAIFIAVFNSLVDSGFSNALIRKTDAKEIDYNTVFITNLVISAFVFILFFAIAPFIGDFFNQPLLVPLCRLMSVIIIINAFAIIQRTLFVKRVDFKTQTKISLISSLISGVIGVGMAFAGYGVWALAWQQISRQLLYTILLWFYGHWFPRIQFSSESFKELFGFGWKLLVSGLIATIWKQIYQVVIGKCYSSFVLGQYSRAHQFADIASTNLTSVLQRVTYPVLSSIQNDVPRLKQAYRRIIKLSMLVSFVLMLGMAAVARPMILVLIGEQWEPAVPLLQLICFNSMLYPLHALNLNMLQVQGRSDLFLKLEIYKKFFGVISISLGIFISIYWMLIGSIIVGFLSFFLNAYYSAPYLKYSAWQQVKDILPSFGVASIMALIVFSMSFLQISSLLLLILQIIAGAILTILLCIAFKLEEYNELKNIVFSFINKKKKNG